MFGEFRALKARLAAKACKKSGLSYWKKEKAFAIISRIAKSVGNSIRYNKHGNNM